MSVFVKAFVAVCWLLFSAASTCCQDKKPAKLEPCDRIELEQKTIVYSISFSYDGKLLAASTSGLPEIRIIDLDTKKTARTIKSSSWVPQVAFSNDGKLVAAAAKDRHAPRLWYTKDGSLYHQFDDIEEPNAAIRFSSNGALVSIFSVAERSVHVWDVRTKKRLKKITSDLPEVRQGVLSPDGKTAAFANGKGEVAVVDVAGGKEIARWPAHDDRLGRLVFSPDSKVMATCSLNPEQARLWNARNGEFLRSLFLPLRLDSFRRMDFSVDGRWIGIASNRSNIPIFDSGNGRQVYELVGLPSSPVWIAFSPDGVTVAASNRDTITFWKLPKEK